MKRGPQTCVLLRKAFPEDTLRCCHLTVITLSSVTSLTKNHLVQYAFHHSLIAYQLPTSRVHRMSSALHSAQLARQMVEGLQEGPHVPPAAAALTPNDAFLLEAGVTLHRCRTDPVAIHTSACTVSAVSASVDVRAVRSLQVLKSE